MKYITLSLVIALTLYQTDLIAKPVDKNKTPYIIVKTRLLNSGVIEYRYSIGKLLEHKIVKNLILANICTVDIVEENKSKSSKALDGKRFGYLKLPNSTRHQKAKYKLLNHKPNDVIIYSSYGPKIIAYELNLEKSDVTNIKGFTYGPACSEGSGEAPTKSHINYINNKNSKVTSQRAP